MRTYTNQKVHKPRIAFLIHNMAGGGAERFVTHLLTCLKDEFEIHLILFDDTIEYELPDDQIIAFIENGFKKRGNLAGIVRLPLNALRLKKYCKENKIELLFSFLNRPNFAACMAKLAGLKIPLMMNECSFTPLWFDEGDLRGKIAKRFISWLYPRADVILPVSEDIRDALIEHYGVNTRYEVVTNVVDLSDIQHKMAEPVDDVSFDKFTFVKLASFTPWKDHVTLVEAFQRLDRKDIQLLLIGKGPRYDEIRELVNSLGLENDILFLGHQRNPFKYLGQSDCFVFVSNFEGQGQVMMEAMACGLPVISTDCKTGPRHVLAPGTTSTFHQGQNVENGRYGVLVPVGNAQALSEAMLEMVEDSELRRLYQEKGYKRVGDYDKDVVMAQVRPIICELLAPATKP